MDKEGKGFNRYSLIVKITKIFNENNFSKVQSQARDRPPSRGGGGTTTYGSLDPV